MNKVFKVIWSEARNAYVVVSEIAKNHGSKSCSTKKLLAMLIATGVMTCASFDVLAAEPTAEPTAAQQYVALKAANFPATGPFRFDRNTWGGLDSYEKASVEWNYQNNGSKNIGGYTYILDTNKYWVRDGYVLTVDQNGGKYTTLSANKIRADVAYNGTGVPKDILQSVTSTVAINGVVTHSGDSLQKVTAGSYAGVSNAGGTGVVGSWNYIIQDSSWKNSDAKYEDGYVDLKGDKMPKGFKTKNLGLQWDDVKQTYTYKGKAVDYRNMYVIDGNLGVFTNADGSEVYTGTVYGENNEILMTVKDNGKFYSYWAASVTDPTATMETYPVSQYNKDLAVIDSDIKAVNKDIIKEVTLTKNTDSATVELKRNSGLAVDGAITVTSGGGTGGNDTFVKISNAADTEGKTFATGSKVAAIGTKDATTGIKINGEAYTIKSGSKVSVAQNDKTTTITVDGKATAITDTDTHNALASAKLDGKKLTITGEDNDSVSVDLSSIDTDTKYTAGNGITISGENNAIAVKLKEGENNLAVTAAGLELNKDLTVDSVKAGATTVNNTGVTIGSGANSVVLSNSNVSMGGQQIHNVAKGTNDTDAVNFGQLKETNTKVENLTVEVGKHTTLVNGENTKATLVKDDANGKQYKVDVDLSGYAKTDNVAVVYVDNNKEKSLHTTNSNAVGSNAIALGKGASALDNSVVIGNGAYTQEGSLLTGSGYSVALGNKAATGTKSTSVGYNAIGGRVGTITVGYNSYNGAAYGTVIGTESKINYSAKKTANAAATIVGAKSEIKNDNKSYSGVANGIFGSANTIENSNGVTIQGSGNTVTNAYRDMSGRDFNLGGVYVKKDAGAVGVIGGMNTVSNQIYTNVIGFGNTVAGDADNISHDVFVAGSRNNLSKVSDSIVMGNDNEISDRSNVISLGHENNITANNAVAIGNGASVSAEGGVALGIGSVADRAAGEVGYDPATGAEHVILENDAARYVWKATKGAVSVGSDRETRQITNVAAGTADTDAVNVAQLKKVSETAANANQGWKLKTTNGNVSNVKPGDEVEFDGDANIQVGNVGNKVSVTLKDTLTGITSITGAGEGAGSISFTDGGIKFNNKVTIGNNGKISGVANGTADNDAVNVSQLNAAKTEVVKGTNIASVGQTTATDDGHTVYTVNAKGTSVSVDGNFNLVETTDAATNVTNYGISLKDSVTIGGTHAVTINGTDGTVTGLTNTTWNKDSITSGRAATEDQLQAVATEAGKHTTLSDGKNTTVTSTNKDGQIDYQVNVAGDLTDITSVANGDSQINLNADSISISNGNKSFAITNSGIGMSYITADYSTKSIMLGENGTTISGGLNVAGSKITGVAKGEADTDAVNVGQLNAAVEAGNTDTHIKAGEYGVGTDNKVNMRLVDKNGNDAGTVTITDVAKASDVGDVNKIAADIKNKEGKTTVVDAVNNLNNKLDTKVGDLQYSKVEKDDIADGDSTTTAIGKLDQKLTDVAATAAKHTTVTKGDNITVTEGVNADGGKEYNVALKNNIDLGDKGSVTTGQTVMNNDGVKVGTDVSLNNDGLNVGKDVSVTGTAVTAGQTSISNDGVKVGDKTYISDKGLNANNNKITNVADGKENSDAVNYGQLKKSETTINNRIDGVENQVISNSNRINQLGNRVNKVGAGAAALAALHPMDFDPDAKWDFAAGYGNYRGTNAAAVGAYYRPNEDTMFSVGGTFGNGENMVNAGVSFKLGAGSSHVSTSRVAMAKEIKELRGELEAMKSAMLDANAGKKIDTSKLQLFPDVPQNHWAYEYVTQLAGNGMIEGYPDGNFAGDRPMTRYEFAAILYRAMTKGAVLSDKILSEFSHELEYFTVDTVAKDKAGNPTIQRVRTVKENTNK